MSNKTFEDLVESATDVDIDRILRLARVGRSTRQAALLTEAHRAVAAFLGDLSRGQRKKTRPREHRDPSAVGL